MSISSSISRFSDYLKRNGVSATARRLSVAARRSLFANRSVLFYCDLPNLGAFPHALPDSLTIERHRSQAELSQEDVEQITSVWNPEIARRNIEERFTLGASIWMIRSNGNLAGYGWTLQGRTVEPHYFPLGANDVQFFDFHVFPKYRGRAMDWFVMTYALHQLAAEGCVRAFGEAAEWNKASISSFGTTPFRRFGAGKKYTIAGHTIVRWANRALRERDDALQPSSVIRQGHTSTEGSFIGGRR